MAQHQALLLTRSPVNAGGWFSIMMAFIFGGIMLLWFWGSSHKAAFFARNFNVHIKKLEDLLVASADSQDPAAPHKLRLVENNKLVWLLTVISARSLSRIATRF